MIQTFLEELTYLLSNYKLTMYLFAILNLVIWEVAGLVGNFLFNKISRDRGKVNSSGS